MCCIKNNVFKDQTRQEINTYTKITNNSLIQTYFPSQTKKKKKRKTLSKHPSNYRHCRFDRFPTTGMITESIDKYYVTVWQSLRVFSFHAATLLAMSTEISANFIITVASLSHPTDCKSRVRERLCWRHKVQILWELSSQYRGLSSGKRQKTSQVYTFQRPTMNLNDIICFFVFFLPLCVHRFKWSGVSSFCHYWILWNASGKRKAEGSAINNTVTCKSTQYTLLTVDQSVFCCDYFFE